VDVDNSATEGLPEVLNLLLSANSVYDDDS